MNLCRTCSKKTNIKRRDGERLECNKCKNKFVYQQVNPRHGEGIVEVKLA